MRLARAIIWRSPDDRPFSIDRFIRFLMTPTSSSTSPVRIFSRLCLKRRFQFPAMTSSSPRSSASTASRSSPVMTARSPAASVASAGTISVISLAMMRIVR